LAGKKLERDLVKKARKAGILVLGPNTMGICNPHIHLYCTGINVRPRPGSTAVVAQSGNMGTQLLAFAEQQGIGIRGFCGSGNEAMITIEDYLDAFETDDLTRIVMLYIESVKNGRRFYESALRVGKKKPIVLLKGGQSKAGNQAAASHTGALTTDSNIFNAACRQAGIVKVEQPMDLLDLSASFSSLPLPKGKRAAVMSLGGGWGVVTADLCSAYGLELPELPPEIIKHFDTLLPQYWSRSNPVDLVGEPDNSLPMIVIEELLKWEGCDAVINLGILGRKIMIKRLGESVLKADPTYTADFIESANREFSKFEERYIAHIVDLMEKYDKPVFGVSLMKDNDDFTVYRVENRHFKGVFFETPERAVKAFAKMVEYHRFLSRYT
jgi:acyl-CoA synthetase (NDP forming)